MRGQRLVDGNRIEELKGVYELEIELMHGDADGYSTIKLLFSDGGYIPSEKKNAVDERGMLLSTIYVLDQLRELDVDDYRSIDGFDELLGKTWKRDHTYDDYLASFDGYTIKHYPSWDGVYEVEIEHYGW
jgi:hypothetical protein